MKLQAIMSLAMALALPVAIQAQDNDMEISSWINRTGISLKVEGAYSRGNFAILVSTDGTGTTELGEDYGSLDMGSPTVLMVGQADSQGQYDVYFRIDPQALADAGVVVYLQAVALNDSPFGDEDQGPGSLRISARLDLDFAEVVHFGNEDTEDPEDEDRDSDDEDGNRRGSDEKTESEIVKN